MKIQAAFLLLAVAATAGQTTETVTLNPQRFSAAQIRQDGDAVHLHGNVVVKLSTLTISTEDFDYQPKFGLTARGESRVTVRPGVRSNPDLPLHDVPDAYGVHHTLFDFPLADRRRFQADEVREDGDTITLRGNVVIGMPAVRIMTAGNATLDKSTAIITVHGDASFVLMKTLVTPADDLGPLTLTDAAPVAPMVNGR